MVCAPDYPLANEVSVQAADLLEYEYISREPGSGTRAAIEHYFAQVDVNAEQLKIIMELGGAQALKQVALSGLGFAIMPCNLVEDELRAGLLKAVPFNPPLQRPLTIVMPRERFRSRTISTFADFVKRQLSLPLS